MLSNQTFWLNDQKYFVTYKSKINISDLLCYFNYQNSPVVVELNNSICIKKFWPKRYISNLDKIEIFTIVGGG